METVLNSDLAQKWSAAGLDLTRLPRHLAVIMDGNGRWASQKGHDRLIGHAKGYETLRDVVDWCGSIGLEFLTVYGFSSENWRRPESEVGGLMELIERAMLEQIQNLKESNVRVKIAGRLHELPPTLQEALQKGVNDTATCTGLTFTLAINYGGRAEILDAVQKLMRDNVNPDAIDENAVFERLYVPELPETDLMIRTAGELRWSNFLLWQSAYAELVITEKTWPEFDQNELLQALLSYQKRTRKFGAIGELDQ